MTSATQPKTTSWGGIDEIVRILDGANLIVHALDGRIARWTAGCAQLYGWSAKEAIGRHVDELLGTVAEGSPEAISARLSEQGSWHGELRQNHRSGRPVFVASRCLVLLPDGDAEPV